MGPSDDDRGQHRAGFGRLLLEEVVTNKIYMVQGSQHGQCDSRSQSGVKSSECDELDAPQLRAVEVASDDVGEDDGCETHGVLSHEGIPHEYQLGELRCGDPAT